MRGLNAALAKIRLLTGSTEFDDLLAGDTNGYQIMLTEDRDDQLELELRNHAATLRDFYPGFSSEIRVTDRTMRFPALFTGNGSLYGGPLAGIHDPDTRLVFSSLTGEPGDGLYFPLNGVRWITPPSRFAALVRANQQDIFMADLFHFGQSPRAIEMELLLLPPGDWSLKLIDAPEGRIVVERSVRLAADNRRIPL
jgi:hypothetical protein